MSDLLALIESRGHWHVIVRPTSYVSTRLATLADTERVFREAHIQLRGWDYPHDPQEGPTRHRDYIEGSITWEAHNELWRLYQSGQFVHFFGMRDDWLKGVHRSDIEPGTVLGSVMTLYSFTELFNFSARLAEAIPLTPEVSVSYEIRGLGGRTLETFDMGLLDVWSGGNQLPTSRASVSCQGRNKIRPDGGGKPDHLAAGSCV